MLVYVDLIHSFSPSDILLLYGYTVINSIFYFKDFGLFFCFDLQTLFWEYSYVLLHMLEYL